MKLIYTLVLGTSLFAELTRTQVVMGTFISITLDKHNKELFSDGFKKLKEVENSLSSYKSSAKIHKLNYNKHVKLDTHTYQALLLSKHYYKKTNGFFNITLGSLTKDLFAFGERNSFIPHQNTLQKSKIGWGNLRFNSDEAYITNGIKVDLGGMGKGYGVDEVVRLYKQKGIKKTIVALSGDIRCLGKCEIALQNPFSDSVVATLSTKKDELGVSTSGNYRRYVSSKKANHLINPYSKQSQDIFASVTLLSEIANADLDAYATAVSVMPLKDALEFLNKLNLHYILITVEKQIYLSEKIESLVSLSWTKDIESQKGRYIKYAPHKQEETYNFNITNKFKSIY